jgi:hypothetical protein
MTAPLPATSPLGGPFWTWVVPIVLFAFSTLATWLLYRHFAGRKPDDS